MIPADFPNFEAGGDIAMVDSLIVMLLQERASLVDPAWRDIARGRIERARRALVDFGDAPYSQNVRCELLVTALDRSERIPNSVERRTAFVCLVLGEAMPGTKLPQAVVHEAVALWPETKRREARTTAVRALARALGCDAPSLMTMLRAARQRVRERTPRARRK